jgi:DNA-directed RNA polymerase subunit beta'
LWYLRGTEVSALKKNDEIVEKLSERILGRVSLHDVYDPETDEILVMQMKSSTKNWLKNRSSWYRNCRSTFTINL